MIIAALNNYYERLLDSRNASISPPGYSMEKISYAIVLNKQGEVVDVEDIRGTSVKKPIPKSLIVPQPEKRTAGIKSNFLWDKTSYVLGVSNSSKRSTQEHAAFKSFHQKALEYSADDGLNALVNFLNNWTPDQIKGNPHFQRYGDDFIDANVVFRLDGEQAYLHERQAARDTRAALLESNTLSKTNICLVSGNNTPIARLHPAIKGVNGAQSSGASIVSFNLDSFSSYGKTQGENAPISERVAFAYTTTLNYLLRRDVQNRQRIQIGDASVVFWAQAADKDSVAAAEDIFAAFMNPESNDAREADKLRTALELIRQGRPLSSQDTKLDAGTRLFVLGLAPNASRLSIRFWETDTMDAFAERLAQHYEDIRLEPLPWTTSPAIWRLLLATAPSRDGKSKSEDVPAHLAGELARSILTGRHYPYSLLGNIIMRMRADGDISGIRVALIKGVLTRFKRLSDKGNNRGELPVSLDTKNTDSGYLLGRLFYLLENAQAQAISGANAGVKEKFYGSASATPALVYPSLMRNFQNHLAKLRKGGEKEKSIAGAVERDAANILDLLGTSFPKNLKLEDQGHFAIGYYHQSRFRGSKGGQDNENFEEGENA